MDVTYASAKLERQCTKTKEMGKTFDVAICKSLRRRITELESAETVADILAGPGRWHWMKADRAGQLVGHLTGNWRIVTTPESTSEECAALTVVLIEDYH